MTRFDTAYGSGLEPREDGSSVAQLGSAERERRSSPERAVADTERERKTEVAARCVLESIMVLVAVVGSSWLLISLQVRL